MSALPALLLHSSCQKQIFRRNVSFFDNHATPRIVLKLFFVIEQVCPGDCSDITDIMVTSGGAMDQDDGPEMNVQGLLPAFCSLKMDEYV